MEMEEGPQKESKVHAKQSGPIFLGILRILMMFFFAAEKSNSAY